MKIVPLTVVFTLVHLASFAQFKTGTMLIGGGLSGSYSNYTSPTGDGDQWDIALMPQVGLFIADNFALGVGSNYQYFSSNDRSDDAKTWSSAISINPFLRYYYKHFFIQGIYQFGRISKRENAVSLDPNDPLLGGSPVVKSKTHGFNLGAGYAAMITENFAVEPLIGYSNSLLKYTDNPTKYTSPGFYVQIGFQVYLTR